ncbi:nicotinate phosphoribosyltransferase [Phyllobacterium myrsinacearum]|uniref:Nicotinamide phosphoribosyltransferase n=1 Tax=Phyllobacterium myrsinacearum TaxID=28101 RepID=A0A839ERZ0_9HYPH|nr:nicotinate phosphoribosyltransferase [Phyllobacterium myrsinacearum]MBA8881699.1 nicotinamide phosphoribosyltransferase [Phyllobacterium myrsinacearum]
MSFRNLILATDSYKQSHFLQYPPQTTAVSAYVEARAGGIFKEVVFVGLQAFIKQYLTEKIDSLDVDEAELVCKEHGLPFNREGWDIIRLEHNGRLPIEIQALAEGSVVPLGTPLVQVRNLDPRLPWLSTFIETALLRAIWYPSTVATLSYHVKKIIYRALLQSSEDPDGQIPFKLHDFGARGVSSSESAALGGFAHLVNFKGTDTMEALEFARRYYGANEMPAFSIPAAEHSTITSWGKDREADAYSNMIDQFGSGIVAVVSDSYDLMNAVENVWGGELKEKVLKMGGTLVVRPDSGDPVTTPLDVLHALWEKFGGTINSKGYKVLNPKVRVIQGDGMDLEKIDRLFCTLLLEGWSADNIAVGMGGGLLQGVMRDDLRFAMKANAIQIDNGEWVPVQKRPATDPTKASKAGRLAVCATRLIDYPVVTLAEDQVELQDNLLKVVYSKGNLEALTSLSELRARTEKRLKEELAA